MAELNQEIVELDKALVELKDEMMIYKDAITSGELQLSAEAAVRFEEAIKELSPGITPNVEDVRYHLERLREVRLGLMGEQVGEE